MTGVHVHSLIYIYITVYECTILCLKQVQYIYKLYILKYTILYYI